MVLYGHCQLVGRAAGAGAIALTQRPAKRACARYVIYRGDTSTKPPHRSRSLFIEVIKHQPAHAFYVLGRSSDKPAQTVLSQADFHSSGVARAWRLVH